MMKKKTKVENFAKANDVKANQPKPATESAKLSYKVYGTDINVTGQDFIDYYKTRTKMMVMRFMLVGRIDDKGVYRIKDEIKYDLIRINKEISDSGEDFYRASSRFINKFFYFNIKIQQIEDGKAKASLYLSEFVDDFLEEEYIVSHIADFVDVYDEHFRAKVRQAYNLMDVAVTNDELKIPNLAVLMQDEYDINEYIGGLYDLASQIYVMRMLKLLEASGDADCLEIIKRYKELIVDKDENDLKEKYKFTKYKALLDRAIDEKGGIEKLNVNKDELKSIVLEINKSVKAIDGAQKRSAMVEVLKTEKGGDSSSGGGGGSKKTAGKKPPSGGNSGGGNDKKAPKAEKSDGPKKDKAEVKPQTQQVDNNAILAAYLNTERKIRELFGEADSRRRQAEEERRAREERLRREEEERLRREEERAREETAHDAEEAEGDDDFALTGDAAVEAEPAESDVVAENAGDSTITTSEEVRPPETVATITDTTITVTIVSDDEPVRTEDTTTPAITPVERPLEDVTNPPVEIDEVEPEVY